MKHSSSLYIPLVLMSLLISMTSCQKKEELDRYIPKTINTEEGVLTYTDLTTYPIQGEITSEVPAFEYEGEYAFLLDSIYAPEGSSFLINQFSIDRDSGAISYNNAGELSPGTYSMDVAISNSLGIVVFEDAFNMEVLEVPLEIMIDNALVEAGALQLGVLATLSYTDLSGGDITSVSYELLEPQPGFELDSNTGEISKTGAVSNPSTTFSVRTVTNLGIKIFEDVLTITIGEAPQLMYFQQDGITPLNKVALSPWTAYTTSMPELSGMEAGGGFEAILPDTLIPFATEFSFDSEGRFSINGEAGLPEGQYYIGMIATNSGGVSATFDSAFTLQIETVWDSDPFIDEDLNDSAAFVPPATAYPGIWSSYIFGGTNGPNWVKVFEIAAGSFSGFRLVNPLDTDAGLIRAIDLNDVYGLRISFGEMLGYGGAFITNYDRALYFGEDISNAMANSFVASDWTPLLDIGNSNWLAINWNGGNGPAQPYNDIEVDLTQITGDTVYIMWRILPTPASSLSQNGAWLIDHFSAEKASAYPAIES